MYQLVGSFMQASQLCGKSVYTLQRWARQGKIRTVKVCGRNQVDFRSLREMLGLEQDTTEAA
jgi:predicted site-specific integrase-resolvase